MNKMIAKQVTSNNKYPGEARLSSDDLAARTEPFDSFWEGPEDVASGYDRFSLFYQRNYLSQMPDDKEASILVVSCGPGYFVNLLREEGFNNVLGIDSYPEKVQHAQARNLNCRAERAFEFLANLADDTYPYDVIFCEQELNHLTKDEIVIFLRLCWRRLKPGGRLIVHVLNGANPITGAEALAQNFDHFNTFTEYSLRQVLEYCDFEDIDVIPLNLYVFYNNPLNYVGMFITSSLTLLFRFFFKLYGKFNRIFTKKIAAVCRKPV
jgi:2-polyprenyl-3-methyl-5-hydroxy-6-metoxy-1,4-benzoquinol methylase